MTEDNLHTKVDLENETPTFGNTLLAAVFFSLIFSTLKNKSKISLK